MEGGRFRRPSSATDGLWLCGRRIAGFGALSYLKFLSDYIFLAG
jgi:hypothetical protein